MANKIGEIIECNAGRFVAECYELNSPPPLGSLVKTHNGEIRIYGVVSGASTESMDPGRRPLARGRNEETEEDIYLQHPQLSSLLRTNFETLMLGHDLGNQMFQYLPPCPPRIHSFVYLCEADDVRRFTQSLDFLSTLLGVRENLIDEIIAACLRQASRTHDEERAFMVRAGKELAVLLGSELNRLNAILRKIRP